MGRVIWTFLSIAIISMIVPGTNTARAAKKNVKIGFLFDGEVVEPKLPNELESLFKKEILELCQQEFKISFPKSLKAYADWSVSGVRASAKKLFANPDLDLLIAVGPLASQVVASLKNISKPAIAANVVDPAAQGIPLKNGTSGVKNLSYITTPLTLTASIQAFRNIATFKHLLVVVPQSLANAFPKSGEDIVHHFSKKGIKVEYILSGKSAKSILTAISPGVDAIFLLPVVNIPSKGIEKLSKALQKRGIVSFSYIGRPHVKLGILAGLSSIEYFSRLARRVALNVQRILLGEDPSTFHVTIAQGTLQLSINMKTAREVGYRPGWDILSEAELIGLEEIQKEVQLLSLKEAADIAVKVNLELLAGRKSVEAGEYEQWLALSDYLPHLSVTGAGAQIDKDRAKSPFTQREKLITGSAKVSQLIFSEKVLANISIQGSLQKGREYELAALELDIIEAATIAYLNVLGTKTFEKIQRSNLQLTKKNLELAQVRDAVGIARPAEVYRWQSQIATDKKSLIEAIATRNQAEINLNRILHRPLEQPLRTVDDDLFSGQLSKAIQRLAVYVDNPWQFDKFRNFMVQEACKDAPELAQLDQAIEAQERALFSAQLNYFLPSASIQFELNHLVEQQGAGKQQEFDLSGIPPEMAAQFGGMFPEMDDTHWTVSLFLSWNLIEGGAGFFKHQQASLELSKLNTTRQASAEMIEQRVRSTLHAAGSTFPGMRLSRDAATAARKSLELVTEAYTRGAVSIVELIDVQNAATQAELASAAAAYDFYIDLMSALRSIGNPTLFSDPTQDDEWFGRLKQFIKEAEKQTQP